MKHIIALLYLSIISISLCAQSYFPPIDSDEWASSPPSSLGYCQENIDSLYAFLEASSSKAFILIKDGKIVLEEYFNEHSATENWYWASAGKSLTATLVGIAQQEGALDIDDVSSIYLGEGWTSSALDQEMRITIKNQLTMTTGLDPSVINPNCTDPQCLLYSADAGTQWAYHNAPYTMLDEVIESATGMNLNVFVRSRINTPIGMNGAYVPVGDSNVFLSTARSMVRFGLLILNKGVWDGNAILSDNNYYNSMITPSQNINPSYGYLWWLNGQSTFMLPQSQIVFPGSIVPNAPSDMVSALGKDGQIISIIPSQNIVWIRMGESPDNLLVPSTLNNEIWDYINKLNCNTVSTTEEALDGKVGIRIFPNPSQEVINVQTDYLIPGDQYCIVYDQSGAVVYKAKVSANNFQITIADLTKGIYSLVINNQIVRFVKE